MIKFFIKIRRRLLTENPPAGTGRAGKNSKYLVYAVGEIVLVVIGILIALQINNWNTSKAEDQIIHNFMKSIESNIEEDLLQLGQLTKRRNDAQRIFPKIVYDLSNKLVSSTDTFKHGFSLAISESQFISN